MTDMKKELEEKYEILKNRDNKLFRVWNDDKDKSIITEIDGYSGNNMQVSVSVDFKYYKNFELIENEIEYRLEQVKQIFEDAEFMYSSIYFKAQYELSIEKTDADYYSLITDDGCYFCQSKDFSKILDVLKALKNLDNYN